MKVVCEYCKNTIDNDKYDKCPSCGADINNNRKIKEAMEIENEKAKLELEQQKINTMRNKEILESQRRGTQFVRILKIGCLIPFILLIVIIVISFVSVIADEVGFNNVEENKKIEEILVQGDYNEPVKTSTYSVTCDGYEEFERYSKPTQGYKYMRFHFTVENISDEEIYDDKTIRALVNGVQCERASFSDKKQLPEEYIMPGAKIDGYIGFEIPEDANNVQIKYGEYITINVNIK